MGDIKISKTELNILGVLSVVGVISTTCLVIVLIII